MVISLNTFSYAWTLRRRTLIALSQPAFACDSAGSTLSGQIVLNDYYTNDAGGRTRAGYGKVTSDALR